MILDLRLGKRMATALFSSALILSACGDETAGSSNDLECNGQGEIAHGHCHCNEGFRRDPDDSLSCIARTASEPIDEPEPDGDNHRPVGRLLVSDGSNGQVVVIDLQEGEAVASLDTLGPARVYANSNGSHGFAVQTSTDAVQGIRPGLEYINHGDHFHAETSSVALWDEVVTTCNRPIHFVAHDGWGATFCDGDGQLHIFDDTASDEPIEPQSFDSGRPHHGVGLVAFDHVLLSIPNPEDLEDALPVGVSALSFEGAQIEAFETCPGLHGEAASERYVCFGCQDGVMCMYQEEDTLVSTKIEAPEDTPDGVRVGQLSASYKSGVFVGNWGENLALLNPQDGSMTPITVGKSILGFKVSDDGEYIFVLSADGNLAKIHIEDQEIEAEEAVIPEFVVESGHRQLRPTFELGHEFIYVVDPRSPEVLELSAESLELTEREIRLPDGQYHSIAVVAVPPGEVYEH